MRQGKVPELLGHMEIGCHVVFDVKMDFTQKARFCANGNETGAPTSMTYSSVVSRDSVRLAFLIAGLNDLGVMVADLENAYLNAPCAEKIWFVAGPECGEDQGKVCVLVRALYGLKSASSSWRSTLSAALRELGLPVLPLQGYGCHDKHATTSPLRYNKLLNGGQQELCCFFGRATSG